MVRPEYDSESAWICGDDIFWLKSVRVKNNIFERNCLGENNGWWLNHTHRCLFWSSNSTTFPHLANAGLIPMRARGPEVQAMVRAVSGWR